MTDKAPWTDECWEVDGPPNNQIVWSGPGARVCFLAHSDGKDTRRDIAKGHLIAAAPEMARALDEASTFIADELAEYTRCACKLDSALNPRLDTMQPEDRAIIEPIERLLAKIDTALSKAKGETDG